MNMKVSYEENDGVKLFETLIRAEADVYRLFSSIEGPYAFAFYRVSFSLRRQAPPHGILLR